MSTILQAKDLNLWYSQNHALHNVNVDIPEHEILTRPAFSTKPFEDVEEDFLLMFHKISALL